MTEAKNKVNEFINRHKVVVFSKTYCTYCDRTKTLLNELHVEFFTVELDTMEDGSDLQAALETITGQATVPNVFINGKSYGGNSDLVKLNKNGELLPLLQKAGAVKAE